LPAIALLAVTFTALILVAVDEVRKKRNRREQKQGGSRGESPLQGGPAGPSFQALADSASAAGPD
jgi:hypothetical protein